MDRPPRTLKQIQQTITISRDSILVINDEIQKLANGQLANKERKDNIYRNVEHLKFIVADKEVIASGEDISDLHAAIVIGQAKLDEAIWPVETPEEE